MLIYANVLYSIKFHFSVGNWQDADFKMYYNLDKSFPGPATYFDMHGFLPDLIAPPIIDFDSKSLDAPIVFTISNCNAFNDRQKYVKQLMDLIKVDSYGNCLTNRNEHTKSHMTGKELFRQCLI